MRTLALLVSVMLLASDLQGADAPPAGGGIAFKVLSGEDTGLKAIMEKWKADELARQGGKFGDHGWWPWGLLALDYNNDGALDLLAQQHGAPQSIVLKNELKEKGKLTFVNANAELGLPTNGLSGCFKPTAMDIDGDGFLDLIYNDAMPNTVFFNREGKKFEPMGLGFGQLDHIRDAEDVSPEGYPNAGNETVRYAFDASTRKYKKTPFENPLYVKPPEAVAALLVDLKKAPKNRFMHIQYFQEVSLGGSGGKDLVCAGFASYGGDLIGRFLISDKDGKLTDATEQLGLPKDGTPIMLADLNGDGFDDVLITGAGLYMSDGKGKYALKPGPVTDYLKNVGPYLHKAFPVDFNQDGQVDLVLNNPRRSSVEIYENLGGGEFKVLHKAGGWDADPVAICDIDNDGLMDVCVGGPAETITIFLNQSPHPGNCCMIFPRMEKPNALAVGTRLEFYKAGELGKPGARPIKTEWAHSNGTPVHIGLGKESAFDLRATFPGKEPKAVEFKALAAKSKLKIAPDGKAEELK
ncbi:MAG: VCBS repeat-containing protein [Planctomycetes bacterium]|nr:VCBS repeat-containing protein [Planctomycetota bacterium]